MKYLCSRLFVALLVYSLATLPRIPAAQGQCYNVEDASYILFYGSCGTNEYELAVDYNGGVEDELCEEYSYGACNGGYYNCNNTWVPYGYDNGGKIFNDYGSDGFSESVSWTLDDWTVSYESCNNGNSNDLQEIDNDNFWTTEEFQVNCV